MFNVDFTLTAALYCDNYKSFSNGQSTTSTLPILLADLIVFFNYLNQSCQQELMYFSKNQHHDVITM